MRQLESFIGTPLASAIGWVLLHSLWQGAIVAGVLAAAMVAVRSPRVRYFAACAAMLVMVGGFSFTFFHTLPKAMGGFGTSGPRTLPAWHDLAESGGSHAGRPNFAAFVPWLAVFWITGVCVIYLRRLAGAISVRRLRRRGVCSAPVHWQKELAHLSAKLRVSRPILLMESCLAEVPLVLGHLRPMILMPIGLLAGLPPAQIEAILLHELAHIRRCDYLMNLLQRLVEGLLFYHPAIWWISRVMRAERENCCDDIAVSISRDTQEYALALAALEQNRLRAYETAIAATGSSLMKRVRRLLHPERATGAWAPFLAGAILVAIGAVSLAAWQPKVPQQNSVAVEPQVVSPPLPQQPEPPRGGPLDSRRTSPDPASAQKHRNSEKEVVQTFYLPATTTHEGLTQLTTALRQILELQYIQQLSTRNVIIIRDTPDKLALAEQIIRDVDKAKELATNSQQATSPSLPQPSTKVVLGDLKIEGDVHDRDGVRDRVLNQFKGQEYGDATQLADILMERGIRADFQNRGYFKVVSDVTGYQALGIADGKQPILLTVSVIEGEQYRFEKLVVRAADTSASIPPPEVVQDLVHLKQGDLFDAGELRDTLGRLKQWYAAHGYGTPELRPGFTFDDTHHLIDVTLDVK
ncbi:MAG TPA: M56 family metallopeptidase [Candidatus Acidoferrales bacterium]|jgi:beta-lactamase regulating signal transducer with metallopeptidase domain|nr:M56 family metallopeptidase [Candidatus Acidoferrales bacterium]